MNYQFKAFQISFLLHGVVIALVIICGTFMGPYKKTTVLNFDLRDPASTVKNFEPTAPAPVIKTQSITPAARQSLKEKEPPRMIEESLKILPVPQAPPAVKLPETRYQEKDPVQIGMQNNSGAVREGSAGIAGAAKEGSGTNLSIANAAGGKESARAKYLNENFAYIRDKILRNVSYPDTARRMGWQGKVLLSFIITANGLVREFKIIKSSGFAMLDKSAVESVKDTAPFPKPPVEAQLVIPIVYRLE
ncbi:MAG: energy transducer TonB [Smithella sp.]|jgi:protein TonB